MPQFKIKNKLLSKGWNSKEIDFYYEFTKYALSFITESLNIAYNVLSYRYSSLLLNYDIKKSNTKAILNKILLEGLEYHIYNAGDNLTMRKLYYLKDNDERPRIMIERILSSIDMIEEHNPYLNRFTGNEEKALLISICSMLQMPKNVIENCISDVNSTLKVFESDLLKGSGDDEDDDTHFYNGIMVRNHVKEIKRKSERKLFILQEMLKSS